MFGFIKAHSATDNLSSPKYRADLDGLRAIAVLSVIGFHAFPFWVKGGFIGVDVFFVISGFLISSIIFENIENGSFSFTSFYARRIKRIFPALILVLVAVYVTGWCLLFADEYRQLGKHILGGAGFVSNFLFWNESGYFDTIVESKPLLHLWSLGIEEQFYIFWPFVIWLGWRLRFNMLLVILVILLASFALNIIKIEAQPVATFYSPLTRCWEFLCGSVLAWITVYKPSIGFDFIQKINFVLRNNLKIVFSLDHKLLSHLVSLIGFLLIALGVSKFTKNITYPGIWALIPVVGTCCIITAGASGWINRKILSNKLLVWVGLISYPLYLWHWPLLSFARILEGDIPARSFRMVSVCVAIILAWLTYILLEKPIRYGVRDNLKTRLLVAGMFSVAFVGLLTFLDSGIPNRSIANQLHDFEYSTGNLEGYKPCDNPLLLADGVELSFCLVNPLRKPTAALIGDSHAEDKFYGLVKNDTNNDWTLLANPSCPPVIAIDVEGDVKHCRKKFENILNYLASEPDIKTVALSFFGNYLLNTAYAADHTKNNVGPNAVSISMEGVTDKSKAEMYYIGLDETLTFLEKSNKKILLFIDVPELPFFPKDCFRNSLKKCDLSREEVLDRQKELREVISKLRSTHASVVFYDPLRFLCSDKFCSYKKDGVIIYRDSHHLSRRGSDLFAKDFLQKGG